MDSRFDKVDTELRATIDYDYFLANKKIICSGQAHIKIKETIHENVLVGVFENANLEIKGVVHYSAKFILKNNAKLTFSVRPPELVIANIEISEKATVKMPEHKLNNSPFYNKTSITKAHSEPIPPKSKRKFF